MKRSAFHIPRLARLTPAQAKALRRWMEKDLLTYQQAIVKLKNSFGVVISHSALAKWFQRNCTHSAVEYPRMALDLRITKAGNGLKITLWQHLRGVNVYAFGEKLRPFQSRTVKKGKPAK